MNPRCAAGQPAFGGAANAARSLGSAELARAGRHVGQRPSVTAVFAMPTADKHKAMTGTRRRRYYRLGLHPRIEHNGCFVCARVPLQEDCNLAHVKSPWSIPNPMILPSAGPYARLLEKADSRS